MYTESKKLTQAEKGKRRGARTQLRVTPSGGSRSSSAARPAACSSPIEQLSGGLWSGPFRGPGTPSRAYISFRLLADRGKTVFTPCQRSLVAR